MRSPAMGGLAGPPHACNAMVICCCTPVWEGPMSFRRRQFLRLAAGAYVLPIVLSHIAWSQPITPLKIVAPFPAGGSVDVLSRLLGEQIGKMHGVTVLVENRPGAGASIAYEAVARSAPDGKTLVINANSV